MGDKLRFNKSSDYGEEYEPTDSEDNYSEEEKELLQNVRQGRRREQESKKELMAFDESADEDGEEDGGDDDDDDDVAGFMGDSDIEGAGEDDTYMPDSKDWGNKARDYYNTDFVDPDFDAYNEEEEEMAKAEEEEAKLIQLRLAQQMQEEDFLMDDTDAVQSEVKDDTKDGKSILEDHTKVKADLSGLTQRERQQLFQKDSPEFRGLIADFEEFLAETDTLLAPILRYVEKREVPRIPALEFAQLYQNMLLTYCSNVGFYLLLKAKRLSVRNHPITKRLLQLKKLLAQLKDKYENIIRPQLEALLERIMDGDDFKVLEIKTKSSSLDAGKPKKAKKSKLGILDQYDETVPQPDAKRTKLDDGIEKDVASSTDDEDDDENAESGEEPPQAEDEEAGVENGEDARRSITYQMAKNKGLMPNRKKELRNPRVKHRSKFRKALIRRKGAVRTVRTETKRYGGEVSGIKATVSKSIKFKS